MSVVSLSATYVAVLGMSRIRPRAPAPLRAVGSNRLSCRIRANSSARSTVKPPFGSQGGEGVERRVVGCAVGTAKDAAEPHGEGRHAAQVGQGYDSLLQRIVAARVDPAKLLFGDIA